MSSLKEQRDKIFQEKLQELGDMGTKVRNEDDAPFYDKPVTSLALPPKEKKEEEITSESTSTISFSQYADLYLTANSTPDTSKTAASWFGACIFLIVAATILRSFFL